MGNMCCAAPDEGMGSSTLDDKKPKLFGKIHAESDSDENEENQTVEERLKDLVPKIREVKNQLDHCLKQQVRLKEEVQASKGADTVSCYSLVSYALTLRFIYRRKYSTKS